jgi:hypothetical protein
MSPALTEKSLVEGKGFGFEDGHSLKIRVLKGKEVNELEGKGNTWGFQENRSRLTKPSISNRLNLRQRRVCSPTCKILFNLKLLHKSSFNPVLIPLALPSPQRGFPL